MLDGVMLLWFTLTAAALLFVAIDIRSTPESPVLKWGFILLTAYTGVVGAFLYVLGCREPMPGLHERYTAARWRQTLGSTMHCVAGDGVGILAGAVLSAVLLLPRPAETAVEYLLGFAFGWTIFQALFMRDTAGGSYRLALARTFIPELLSMNLLMAGMIPTVMVLRRFVESAGNPAAPAFWFVMSMGLLVGFIVAYPMNWWLVANHLKHGMMTVRPAAVAADPHGTGTAMSGAEHGAQHGEMAGMSMVESAVPRPPVPVMTVLSFVALAAGLAIPFLLPPHQTSAFFCSLFAAKNPQLRHCEVISALPDRNGQMPEGVTGDANASYPPNGAYPPLLCSGRCGIGICFRRERRERTDRELGPNCRAADGDPTRRIKIGQITPPPCHLRQES